ncbi:MAG: tRNA pseudouridine(38-40) synthase TruA [Pseudomonadota bacterium]
MQRIALGIEYDGRRFHGWQAQRGQIRTVQHTLEQALTQVAAHPVRVACAGRTDTGVHALAQVVHFDTTASRTSHNWVAGTNANLPQDVNVCWAQSVSADFHARYSALGRHYRYQILNRPVRSSLWAGRATWVYRPLTVARMHQAAQVLVGTHDFSSYRARACQAASPVRTLHQIRVEQQHELIILTVHANAFLQHMVRNIAGVLITIGQGDRPARWAEQVLQARDRTLGGITAAPDGLYFAGVDYPPAFAPGPTLSGLPSA